MIDEKLIVETGGYDVETGAHYDPENNSIWVTARIDGRHLTKKLTVLPRAGYSQEQLVYDVEVFRHQLAAELAGQHHVAVVMPAAMKPTTDAPPRAAAPRFKKPAPLTPI